MTVMCLSVRNTSVLRRAEEAWCAALLLSPIPIVVWREGAMQIHPIAHQGSIR